MQPQQPPHLTPPPPQTHTTFITYYTTSSSSLQQNEHQQQQNNCCYFMTPTPTPPPPTYYSAVPGPSSEYHFPQYFTTPQQPTFMATPPLPVPQLQPTYLASPSLPPQAHNSPNTQKRPATDNTVEVPKKKKKKPFIEKDVVLKVVVPGSDQPILVTAPGSRKTVICENWKNGSCKFGPSCYYAHGVDEMILTHRHPLYKTLPCNKFHLGLCQFGDKCDFIH